MELDVNELGSDEDMQQEHVEKINNLHSTGESIENDGMVPFIGMEFESKDTALSFYKNYAQTVGFGVAIKSSHHSKSSYRYIDVKYICTKSGTKQKSDAIHPRPYLKVDCKAIFHIKLGQSGKWFVHNFIDDHNHELFPKHAHYFSCHRSIDIVQKQSINTLHAVGVKTSKIYATMTKQCDGYENIGCLEKDIQNHLDKEHRLALEVGDANAMLEYFIQMQEENPKFFYAIDLDEEQRLRNVFWVDAKGRDDYQDFGDVVSFDTTYITNKYKMPFAPFIGVNNHFQSTLLGCALLADESSTTFALLMKTWVRAMGGKPPNAIITYQDKAMKAAIALVFPNAQHRYCLWHILRKVPEKLGHVIRNHEDFMSFFNRCIYKSWTREKFEERWKEMIKRFELVEDEWLQTLYEEREHWVPVYMKDAFFSGMSTTQRSESINSFFDKYVGKKTSLKEFVEQYKVAVQDRKEVEKQADFNSWQKQPSLKTPSPFEKQMSMIYTHEVFKKFQVKILGISRCYPSKDGEDGQITTFKVFDFEKREDFIAEWDASREEISCLCHLFEYNGFLCRHTMATLQGLGVFSIPSRYILRRWTKDIRNNNKSGVVEKVQCKKQRYDQLLQQANQLFEEGSLCHESYNFVSHALQETLEKCVNINHSLQIGVNEIQNVGKENICTNKLPMVPIFDPKVSKTKGAPRRI